jgi:hypothetical protein
MIQGWYIPLTMLLLVTIIMGTGGILSIRYREKLEREEKEQQEHSGKAQ